MRINPSHGFGLVGNAKKQKTEKVILLKASATEQANLAIGWQRPVVSKVAPKQNNDTISKWCSCAALHHGIESSMEANLACLPALSTEWLSWVAKVWTMTQSHRPHWTRGAKTQGIPLRKNTGFPPQRVNQTHFHTFSCLFRSSRGKYLSTIKLSTRPSPANRNPCLPRGSWIETIKRHTSDLVLWVDLSEDARRPCKHLLVWLKRQLTPENSIVRWRNRFCWKSEPERRRNTLKVLLFLHPRLALTTRDCKTTKKSMWRDDKWWVVCMGEETQTPSG